MRRLINWLFADILAELRLINRRLSMVIQQQNTVAEAIPSPEPVIEILREISRKLDVLVEHQKLPPPPVKVTVISAPPLAVEKVLEPEAHELEPTLEFGALQPLQPLQSWGGKQ